MSKIAKIALALPIDMLFDYSIPQNLRDKLQIGMRVRILFNHKEHTGYVISKAQKSYIRHLNPILSIIDEAPLINESFMTLAKQIKDYYACSLGEALEAFLPNALKHLKKTKINFTPLPETQKESPKEKAKISYISAPEKTLWDYFNKIISSKINNGERVLFLIPEIQMAPETLEFLKDIPGIKPALLHSKISSSKTLKLWQDIASNRINLLIGTRISIFTPLENPGLIIIKDEDNYAYKEDQVPYYNTIKIAFMRSQIENADVLLSSLIPSAQTYHLIQNQEILYIEEDIKKQKSNVNIQFTKISYKDKIDVILEQAISSGISQKEKTLIFLNKKGFATSVYCPNCKITLQCKRCSSNLRLDHKKNKLTCPSCKSESEASEICPQCKGTYVQYRGLGTEKLESNLKMAFPQANILIFDKTETSQDILKADIVITSNKNLNLKNFYPDTTIIWNLDSLLNTTNFRSTEETLQTLQQFFNITKKKMFISTYLDPDFYLLKSFREQDLASFYKEELSMRKSLKLPPYYHLALIGIRGYDKETTQDTALKLYESLKKTKKIEVSAPYQTSHWRLREKFYRHILIKSHDINLLNRIIKNKIKKSSNRKTIITANIDPV